MQLSEYSPKFADLGINIVTITYDSNEDAQKFRTRNEIAFPIAQDVDSTLIKQLGILNQGPKPGDSAYGIPYPGLFLVDAKGKIVSTFAEQSYRDRPNLDEVLDAAANI